jgi:hypothetical protein
MENKVLDEAHEDFASAISRSDRARFDGEFTVGNRRCQVIFSKLNRTAI